MAKKVFLLELGSCRFDQSRFKDSDIELTTSLFDSDAIIVYGGHYCCPSREDGWKQTVELIEMHRSKHFWVVWGNDRGLCEDILNKKLSNATFLSPKDFDPSRL
jgi:hypothetical protein